MVWISLESVNRCLFGDMAREGLRGTTRGVKDVFESCVIVDLVAIELHEEGVEVVAKSAS